ncbi:MAG: phosphotransferase [Nocardioides sp.]|uniref:phosphotransferase enzyme family protein n=1 Tax=Nocardioides sp. TaxID=35761 RepID=UPI0039E420B2
MTELSLEGTDLIARAALPAYGVSPGTRLRLINLSENATFLVTDPIRGRSVLRVHRLGYHSRAAIESELAWTGALRAAGTIATPAVIPTVTGERVLTLQAPGTGGPDRHAVMFAWVPGGEPDPTDPASFERLGAMTARLHEQSRGWRRPDAFTRFSWDEDSILGGRPGHDPRWGHWQRGIGIGPAEQAVLAPAVARIRERLAAYGRGQDRFGLVHADLRLANLLVSPTSEQGLGETTVIDFDDCGLSWFMFDWGAAVSFIEDDPRLPQWQDAWLTGYSTVGPVDSEDEAILPTMVMLRRLQLTAWMGTHSHAAEVARLGVSFVQGTLRLAHDYLS